MAKQTQQESSRQKRQYWQAKIESWKQSGMSQAAYCRSRDLKVKTFSYWLRKLRKEKAGRVQFVELPTEKLFSCYQAERRITGLRLIVDNRFSIEVADGFKPDTLKQVIETIRQM